MKFTCDRSALVDKLGVLARGVSTRSALPVLSGILLQAGEGRLDLFSTDMELSIKANLATPVEREGEIVVPARLFSDVVRNLPDEEVVIEAGEAAVKVSAGRAAFSLNAWAAADFPQTSTFDMTGAFKVGREPFVETLNKVGRAASRDETRPILTGVLMTIMGDTLKMVATDSYRLAVKETKLDHSLETEVQAIVPVKALGEVTRLAAALGPGDIEVAIGENQAVFKLSDPAGDVWIASRLIEGQFPNYKQLLPDTFEHEVTIDRGQLMATATARQPAGAEERAAPPVVRREPPHDEGAHAGRRPGGGDARRGVLRRAVRDRLQPRVPHRGRRRRRRRGDAAALHQPAASRPHQRPGRRLHVPHHADPPEQLIAAALTRTVATWTTSPSAARCPSGRS